MTSTEALRAQIEKYLDNANEQSLRMVRAMLQESQDTDFWDDLPSSVHDDIKIAKEQSKKGLGKSTNDVLKKYHR